VGVTTRPTLLLPGLIPPDPSRESYRVRPGAATVVSLRPDDRLTIRDLSGGQQAELTAVAPDGREDAAALGTHADLPASVLRRLVGSAAEGAAEVVQGLAGLGLDPMTASASVLFGPTSPAGAEETFRAERNVVVVVGAPEGAPVVEGGVPASDLLLEVRRATPREHLEPALPDPLAEPRLDFQVDRASARAYEVRAGEYIQVLDVQGRQCSDFLAFHAGKLQDGRERGLDSTTTRSLMGQAYPQPGLHGKFYDQDQEPLVEVVRDTVGRHDTFGLACTAKYYEDMGYFGHVNCSENFNGELQPYTIDPRKGWPALNFFYNTGFDANNLYVMDEPWSRPGDYVLLRAMTDLVCLSSACPDDIDPANAWNPTEVHVRVYPATSQS
jgi:aminomethyltransferase